MIPSIDDRVMRITNSIYPIINTVITGPQGPVIRDRIRKEVTDVITAIRAEGTARRQTADNDAAAATAAAVATARAEEQNRAREQRASDKTAADAVLAAAVASARADEKQKASAAASAEATAAANDKAAALAAAETKRVADVAAARTDERAKCVAEIQVAPVTGITVALTLFATSMRSQIKAYVASGPH